MVFPVDTGEVQIREMRQAFYAGPTVLCTMLLNGADPGDEVTDGDIAFLQSLQGEIDAFGAEFDRLHLPEA